MNPRDASMLWMAAKFPNDQFLVYAFDSPTVDVAALRAHVAERAAAIADLGIRVAPAPWNLDYPRWVAKLFDGSELVVHELVRRTWVQCRDRIAELVTTTVDTTVSPWRLHVFCAVSQVPGCASTGLVAVLQVSHALADGARAASIARALFGPDEPAGPTPVDSGMPGPALAVAGVARVPLQVLRLLRAGRRAHAAHREATAATESGTLPPPEPGRAVTSVNIGGDVHDVRMTLSSKEIVRVPNHSITVVALTAISCALSTYLVAVPDRLGAEVTVALSGDRGARNRYANVGVNLFPDEPDLHERATKIARSLAERRDRIAHPAVRAEGQALYAMPAPLLHAGITRFDTTRRPDTVAGHTVVTSIDRGTADLRFGGGTVRFTAGFPALSPAMGLTHGIYGIGDTVAVCTHSNRVAVPDADEYADLLRTALDTVCRALSGP